MRRRFARRIGRPMRGILRDGIPPLLLRANQLLSSGDYAEAADGLEQLAQGAEGGRGRRAAQLYLEAGRARFMAGHGAAGMALLRQGLEILAASGAWLHFARAGRRVVAELEGRGYASEADELRRTLEALGASARDVVGEVDRGPARPTLPTRCPDCGAPVHPDEVEWLDSTTAECEYCGTPMRSM